MLFTFHPKIMLTNINYNKGMVYDALGKYNEALD